MKEAIDGKEAKMIVDTEASQTIVRRNMAKEWRIRPLERSMVLTSVTGKITSISGQIDSKLSNKINLDCCKRKMRIADEKLIMVNSRPGQPISKIKEKYKCLKQYRVDGQYSRMTVSQILSSETNNWNLEISALFYNGKKVEELDRPGKKSTH